MTRTDFIALLSGLLFGLGLAMSEMINPARVIGFLDVTGQWDPTLILVMGGALSVTLLTFPFITRKSKPLCADSFSLPTKTQIDARLLLGAELFGVGWGIAGFCPGPAVAALATGSIEVLKFVGAMLVGYALVTFIDSPG